MQTFKHVLISASYLKKKRKAKENNIHPLADTALKIEKRENIGKRDIFTKNYLV